MIKILYDFEAFSMQRYGGITRYFSELIMRIAKFNDISILLYMGLNINEYGLEKKIDTIGLSKKIPFIPKTKFLITKLQKPIFEIYRKKLEYDILHQTYYNNYIKLPGKKRIVTVHDFTHEHYPQYFSKLDNTIENKKKAVLNADAVICVSNSTKNDLLNFYGYDLEGKIKVIYHGNSFEDYLENKEFKNNIQKENFILFVGERYLYKNFDVLLKAYNKSEFLKKNYIIKCFGGKPFSRKEKKYLKELNLSSKIVHKVGNYNTLAEEYKRASVLVYPSYYEGFGIPLVEAMSLGTPVIASNKSSLPEIGGDAVILFTPNNDEELKSKLELILQDEYLQKKMIELGFQRAKIFSWNKCAEETYKLYKDIYGK
ncbi:MAG: glycosyltransferase family 4 protein [Ignavibacteria bacterium]|nr:glycosyltransferase family 4 protein [Ignavibacteria bacterium]